MRLIIPFIAGILTSVNLPGCYVPAGNLSLLSLSAFVVLSTSMFAYLYNYRSRWMHGLLIIMLMFACGFDLTDRKKLLRTETLASLPEGDHIYLAIVKDHFTMRPRSCKGVVELQAYRDSAGWKTCRVVLVVYSRPDSALLSAERGAVMLFYTDPEPVDPPANPGSFDYREYLARQGIYHDVFLGEGEWMITGHAASRDLMDHAAEIRDGLLGKLAGSGIGIAETGVAAAMLLGDNTYLGGDVRDVYARAGAMHILCVSGLHVGVVFLVLSTMLGFLRKLPGGRLLYSFILVVAIWSYALLTGLAAPVARAASMLSFIIVGQAFRRNTNVFNSLAAAAMISLMADPFAILGAGFQLSYAAVLGIVCLQRPIYNLFYFGYRVPDRIWAITAVSIAAQLGTLPLSLYYFHQYPLYSLLTNLIVIPLSSLVIYAGLLFFIFPAQTLASSAATWILGKLLMLLDKGVTMVESLPGSAIREIHFDGPMALLLACTIIFMGVFFLRKGSWALIPGLLTILALSGYRMLTHYDSLQQQVLVIYSVNGHTAADIINGRDHIFIADSALLGSPEKTAYSISPYWLKERLKDCDTMALGLEDRMLHKAQIITINDRSLRLGFWQGAFPRCRPPDQKLKLDVLVLRGECPFGMDDLFKWFNPGHVIIDSSVPPWVDVPEGDDRFWRVRTQGAFVMEQAAGY